jgi:cytochrome c oxidase subunit 2
MTKRTGSSAAPAVFFAFLLLLLVGGTLSHFALAKYHAPPPITATAQEVDQQYHLTLYVMGGIFVFAQLILAFAVVWYRDRGRRARFFSGNNALEIAWTAAAVILFLGLGVLGRKAWADVRYTGPEAGAVQIEVTGAQFVFTFRYPGADGLFGKLDPQLISASSGNPLGLDPGDPAGRDDIVSSTLTVPVGRPVELLIRSQDVIHNFFVRELRLQQDAVPGLVIPIHFTAQRTGRFDIVCTQLCGLGHQKMHAYMDVVDEGSYENLLRQQAANR